MFVDALTDNRNRTGSEIRSLFTRAGGSLAEPGAVAWQFERKGVVVVPAAAPDASDSAGAAPDEDELILVALDAGAEDVEREGDTWRVTAAAADTMAVREAIEASGIAVTSADLTYSPQNLIELTSVSEAKQVMAVLDALDDHDDVQGVYANIDISDSLLEQIAN